MRKLLETDNYCAFVKAKPSHYKYVMNYESRSHTKVRLNLLPICVVQIIVSSRGQSSCDAFPALGFICWLRDQITMSNSSKRFPIDCVLAIFSCAALSCSLIDAALWEVLLHSVPCLVSWSFASKPKNPLKMQSLRLSCIPQSDLFPVPNSKPQLKQ